MAAEKMSFEQSMTRLEEIVRTLEGGSATLDESLKLYEEGVALVRACSTKLDEAENKIRLLNVTQDGVAGDEDVTK